jgi:peptidoglycan/LPS O-acetylase OafA/YrhL
VDRASQHEELVSERLAPLDGVRGIAIVFVVVWHYKNLAPGIVGSTLSWSGVDLFFVLSGYLIGGILLDHINEPNWWRVFYIRRFLRIVPLYVLGLLVGAVFFGTTNAVPFIYFLTFTQNFWIAIHASWPSYSGVTWSLAVEEQFYILLPLLVWLLPRRWLPAIIATLIIAAPICRVFALDLRVDPVAIYVLFPFRMDPLFCGVLCAYAMRQEKFREWIFSNRATLYLVFAASFAWPVLAILKGWNWKSFEMESFGFTLLAVTYSCFLLIVVVEKSGPIAWLTNLALLRRLGLLAYCIYLFHRDLYNGSLRLIPTDVYASLSNITGVGVIECLHSGVIVLCVLGIAEMSSRFFEGPLISLGRRWTYSAPVISRQEGFKPTRNSSPHLDHSGVPVSV